MRKIAFVHIARWALKSAGAERIIKTIKKHPALPE
jgi:hypothetical protein